MLKFVNYNIVFQEVPNETTLAVNLSRCPNKCKGCHSAYLQEDVGEVLDEKIVAMLLRKYENAITCICFMGGDNDPQMVEQLSAFTKRHSIYKIKTAWYSGKSSLPDNCNLKHFDYIKIGPYIEEFGALESPTTNQRFYKIVDGKLTDKTGLFTKKREYNLAV